MNIKKEKKNYPMMITHMFDIFFYGVYIFFFALSNHKKEFNTMRVFLFSICRGWRRL
jgi:hypothetical protein